jgi:hypothetical protein
MSVRLDPLNLILVGDLNLELEVAPLKWLSVEVIPSFVVNDKPPTFGYLNGRDAQLTRKSRGLGPLAGVTVDAGFWLEGKAMRGTVLRVMFRSHSYEYEASDSVGVFDRLRTTERVLAGFLGNQSRIGLFTISSGFGIGGVIGGQKRCFTEAELPTSQCRRNEQSIMVTRHRHDDDPTRDPPLMLLDMNGFLGSVRILGRLSLGVVF